MEWLTSAEGLNACQELEASVREHHPNLRDEEVDLIVDGRLLCMVRERAAEQAPASGQQGGTSEGGAVHEAPTVVGVGGGAVAPTIDTGMIGASYDQFKFGVEHISVMPLLEGRHDLTAWVSAIRPQLQCADLWQFCNGTAPRPAPNNPLQRREYAKGQMLAFMVLNRCVSPPIRMSISGFSQQEKAGQLAWAYILSTYQVRDALHASLLQTQLAQLRKGDDETAESYCNRARTIRAELLTIRQEVHMATFAAHVLKGLPPEYGFLRRKLEISSPDMTVERVCSEVLMEEQTLSIEQSYKQITSDASAFSGAVNTIVATTGVNGKEGKGGREQTDKKKDGKREKKRAPFKGRCYNYNEEGHMAAKCPNKKKVTTPAAAANVAEGDGKGVALTVACSAAKLLADDKDLWFLDSGCSQHMTGRKEWFTVIRDPSATKSVKGFDGSMQEVADAFAEVVSSAPEENDEAASLTTYAVGTEAMLNLRHTHLENDHAGAVQWTATNSGMLGMDLEKGGEDTSSASSQEAKLTRQTLPLPDEREGEVLGMVHGPGQNQPPSRTVIIITVPSVQGGEQPFDRSVDPAGSNATMAPPALCPSLAAGLAPVGPEVGPSADERRAADEDKEGEATDLKSAATHGKDPIPTVPPLQPTPPPPCHSSRSNKGMPPVQFPTSTMTASDADDGNNMYDMAFLAGGVYGTDIYYDVEYLDEVDEEEGGLGSVIINLGVTLTGPEGKVVDKGLLVVEYMSSTEGYLGLQIVRDRPNKSLLLHENAYVAKVQQRFFKGAPPKKQPITPLSSTSFVMEDAELFADRTMTDRLAAVDRFLQSLVRWNRAFKLYQAAIVVEFYREVAGTGGGGEVWPLCEWLYRDYRGWGRVWRKEGGKGVRFQGGG
ncbi:unnamed protein product [Closterium sp. Naga37s-1]|nr:unnamed protein product [Closterium sp. Naga37s-1]